MDNIISSVGKVQTQSFESKETLILESGDQLESLEIVFETYGNLNSERTNAILVCHALSGSHHSAGYYEDPDERKGWWDSLTEEEQKKVGIFILMRYTSAVQTKNPDIEYHYLALTNELVNKHYNILRHEVQLQHKLLQCVGLGTTQFHPWIPPSKQRKGKTGKLVKW